jgi:molecular chaperone DnaK (HSP70)
LATKILRKEKAEAAQAKAELLLNKVQEVLLFHQGGLNEEKLEKFKQMKEEIQNMIEGDKEFIQMLCESLQLKSELLQRQRAPNIEDIKARCKYWARRGR